MRGVIVKFFDGRGFGFVRPDDGESDVFFHVKNRVDLPYGVTPGAQDEVEFDIIADPKNGKPMAANVRLKACEIADVEPKFQKINGGGLFYSYSSIALSITSIAR
jgi:cold shock protein